MIDYSTVGGNPGADVTFDHNIIMLRVSANNTQEKSDNIPEETDSTDSSSGVSDEVYRSTDDISVVNDGTTNLPRSTLDDRFQSAEDLLFVADKTDAAMSNIEKCTPSNNDDVTGHGSGMSRFPRCLSEEMLPIHLMNDESAIQSENYLSAHRPRLANNSVTEPHGTEVFSPSNDAEIKLEHSCSNVTDVHQDVSKWRRFRSGPRDVCNEEYDSDRDADINSTKHDATRRKSRSLQRDTHKIPRYKSPRRFRRKRENRVEAHQRTVRIDRCSDAGEENIASSDTHSISKNDISEREILKTASKKPAGRSESLEQQPESYLQTQPISEHMAGHKDEHLSTVSADDWKAYNEACNDDLIAKTAIKIDTNTDDNASNQAEFAVGDRRNSAENDAIRHTHLNDIDNTANINLPHLSSSNIIAGNFSQNFNLSDFADSTSIHEQTVADTIIEEIPEIDFERPLSNLSGSSDDSEIPSLYEDARDVDTQRECSSTVLHKKPKVKSFLQRLRQKFRSKDTAQIENDCSSAKELPSVEMDSIGFEDETSAFYDACEIQSYYSYKEKQLRFALGGDKYNEICPTSDSDIDDEECVIPEYLVKRRDSKHWRLEQRRQDLITCCKKTLAFLFSHIGLLSMMITYCIIGGIIFVEIEKPWEQAQQKTVKAYREDVLKKVKQFAQNIERSQLSMDNFTAMVDQELRMFEFAVFNATKNFGWTGNDTGEGNYVETQWSFSSSLLYAVTVMTTIGYGHVAPKTKSGRLVTIAYAVIGIPLTLLCLTNIGDLMAKGFRLLYGKVCCTMCCVFFQNPRDRPADIEKGEVRVTFGQETDRPNEVIHVPTSLCILLIAFYILGGAVLFAVWEDWDMLTGSYFCFITLSTIGFGDIVPGTKSWKDDSKLVLCVLYLVLGLSLLAMCFTLVQEDVKSKSRWLGQKIGILEKQEL